MKKSPKLQSSYFMWDKKVKKRVSEPLVLIVTGENTQDKFRRSGDVRY